VISSLTTALEELDTGRLVIVTGAGISAASGIPTFRGTDPDAVWKKDITELGTYRYFRQDPVGSWRWYLERFRHVEGARPNRGQVRIIPSAGRR
jgi:NAD-dependent deacetylase